VTKKRIEFGADDVTHRKALRLTAVLTAVRSRLRLKINPTSVFVSPMKSSLRNLLAVLALGAAVLPVVSVAQDAPPPEKQRGPGGPGGGRGGMMTPEQQVERLDQALALTAEQKTKITAIIKEQAAAMQAIPAEERRDKMAEMRKAIQEKIRATLTPEQMKKFDDMPPAGGGRGGPGGPGGKKKEN
jgi:Spy/CpxP family protein refolding chaperone